MKTLFVHGMGGRPKEWQLDALRDYNLEPYALHLDYTRMTDPFTYLKEYAKEKQIEFLVGRSHGGYLSYWLSEELGIPCLIMNPHLSVRLKDKMHPKTLTQRASPLCLLVLGTDDDLVDPERTLQYFEEEKRLGHAKNHKIRMMDGVGHWLANDTFSDMVAWALDEIQSLPTTSQP